MTEKSGQTGNPLWLIAKMEKHLNSVMAAAISIKRMLMIDFKSS